MSRGSDWLDVVHPKTAPVFWFAPFQNMYVIYIYLYIRLCALQPRLNSLLNKSEGKAARAWLSSSFANVPVEPSGVNPKEENSTKCSSKIILLLEVDFLVIHGSRYQLSRLFPINHVRNKDSLGLVFVSGSRTWHGKPHMGWFVTAVWFWCDLIAINGQNDDCIRIQMCIESCMVIYLCKTTGRFKIE